MTRDGDWRRRRLADAVLYLCVDRRAEQGDLPELLDAVLANGVDVVQLRDKAAGVDELRAAAAVFRAAAERHGALFVLNDDPSLSVEVHADGVHVGQDDALPAEARVIVGVERIVGRSTHTVAEIDRALVEDCDYFAVGPVHATPTKQGRPPIGLEPLRHAAAVAGDRPWFVTGGMAPATAPAVLATGARRLVVVRALSEAARPAAAAAELAALLRRA
ncbi:MAG TPA: thiamine phosphate synthase [Egibacteraceae bacterium]|nr:thiamine phosphate synthase [Egibacteraceae bacterium]